MAGGGADLLGGLKEVYLKQLKARLATLLQVILDINMGRADASNFKALQAEAHRLNGTGATYGFPNISVTAEKLEAYLASGQRHAAEIIRLLNPLVEAIGESLTQRDAEASGNTATRAANFQTLAAAYKPTILVADDDPAILNLVRQLLSPWASVRCTESGHEALSALERRRFDLVILDYELADISGLEVLILAGRMESDLRSPVMMLSATREHEKVLRLIAAGAQNYLVKPIVPELLLKKVALLLNRQKKTILIADDDPLIREIFRRRFVQRGHEVALAMNGVQALEVARKVHPRAILLDRQMPRMDGNQFLQELRRNKDTASIPVVMLSAQCTSADIYAGYRDGANVYISKPFVPDQVIKTCESFLNTMKLDDEPSGLGDGQVINA